MALTQLQAKDEMFTMFRTAWNALVGGALSVVSPYQATIPEVYYHGVEKPLIPPSDKYFAILDMIVVDRKQKTLAIDVVNFGDKMYNNRGLLRLQIVCPLSDAENSDRGLRLGMVARDAFDGKRSPCGVVFFNGTITPSLSTEVFSKHIMTVEYQYEDIN
jgi:hypothetical protein